MKYEKKYGIRKVRRGETMKSHIYERGVLILPDKTGKQASHHDKITWMDIWRERHRQLPCKDMKYKPLFLTVLLLLGCLFGTNTSENTTANTTVGENVTVREVFQKTDYLAKENLLDVGWEESLANFVNGILQDNLMTGAVVAALVGIFGIFLLWGKIVGLLEAVKHVGLALLILLAIIMLAIAFRVI